MAYIRQHGNQIAIVSGDRDKETGKVQQQVLFTFYSRDEAMAALGTSPDNRKHFFQNLMHQAYPSASFDWEKINRAIEQKIDTLPEKYEGRISQCNDDLSRSITGFARKLVLADPYLVPTASVVLKSQKTSLMALRELIDHSLSLIDFYGTHPHEDELDRKDSFHWRYTLRGLEVPPDLEEWAEGFYRRKEYKMAEAIFELLVSAFDNYAEGYNYLGLIALEQRQYKKAIRHFEKTVAIGRNLFPRKLPKSDFWQDHSTRPFMRGMTNLILALTCDGDYEKALAVCNKYEKECGKKSAASIYKATIYLDIGDWDKAIEYSSGEHDFITAFTLVELGDELKGLACFLSNAVESPHTARLLLNMSKFKPNNSSAVEDHNYGVHLLAQLSGYFHKQSAQAKKFFGTLAKQPAFIEMLQKIDEYTHNHFNGKRENHSENFKEWHSMKEKAYLKKKAQELMSGIKSGGLKVRK